MRYALTTAQISFLNEYMPEDRFMTSMAEVNSVKKAMGLLDGEKTIEEYTAMRNAVVQFYDLKMGDDRDLSWSLMPALQSVTAVIDIFIYRTND